MRSFSLVLDPDFSFGSLDASLAALGFRRDPSVRPVTPDVIPGEPELAAWARVDGPERLTYTFNPVVSLRVIDATGLKAEAAAALALRLPVLDAGALVALLAETDSRRILLGLFAARALGARTLAPAVAPLAAHPDPTVRQAAQGTLTALQAAGGGDARQQALDVLRVLSEQAVPVLAALVGPEGPAALESLRPRAEDYALVFRGDVAEATRAAYERIWRSPPEMERLESGELVLRVDAAPAGMLREDNELSRRFPGGYRALAPYLQPHRIWFVWRYVRAGDEAGTRHDGVVRIDDRWAWFPKPYRVVGEILGRPATGA